MRSSDSRHATMYEHPIDATIGHMYLHLRCNGRYRQPHCPACCFLNSLEPMDTYLPSIQMDIFSYTQTSSQRWSVLKWNMSGHNHHTWSALNLISLHCNALSSLPEPFSLWTSLNLSHWTSWMRRWRTTIKRRWVEQCDPSLDSLCTVVSYS